MIKNSIILLFILFFGTNVLLAQDGIMKSKNIEISFNKIAYKDSLLSIELYQNGIFESRWGRYTADYSFDSLKNSYTLRYLYQGIGGGRTDNLLNCPELFVKANFLNKDNREYFQLIPLVLSICGSSEIREIKVLNIDLNDLIEQTDKMILISENNTYQIVTKEDFKMGKLVKIEGSL